MNLIFLYGPPAVGKLTVAKELAAITDCTVFHNHLTIELVESVFEWGTPVFTSYVDKYRLELIEAAAKHKIPSLIFTYVYANTKGEDVFIRKVIRAVRRHGGTVHFVQLFCAKQELFKRLGGSSRRKHSKMKSPATLTAMMKEYDIFQPVPHAESLRIDNTKISAKKAAATIKRHFALVKTKLR